MDEIHENDVVALLVDQPDTGLRRGDVGTVVHVFTSTAGHPSGVIVEFMDEVGTVLGQADIVDTTQIMKLRIRPIREAA